MPHVINIAKNRGCVILRGHKWPLKAASRRNYTFFKRESKLNIPCLVFFFGRSIIEVTMTYQGQNICVSSVTVLDVKFTSEILSIMSLVFTINFTFELSRIYEQLRCLRNI